MSAKKTGQEGLLLWLQARTSGYNGVNVVDFTRSWENGLAFCALIHSFHPDAIPFDTLKPDDKAGNLKLAFDTAEKLGVPALMDPEDMLMDCGPDKFSVITYVSQYFHKFKDFDNKDGSDEVQVKAPALSKDEEVALRRQKIEQERMLQRKCAKCQQGFPNGGTIIDALSKHYHPDCFVCFSCIKPFKDNKFVNVDGNPYCPICAKDKFTSKSMPPVEEDNPPCFKCKKVCEGDTVNALGHSWHPECFTCTTCNKLFQAGVAKVLNVDGMPYCEQCGRRAFVSRRTVASPTPPSGLSKSKSMGAIPKMMDMASDSPNAKPLLGGPTLGSLSGRLQAFQKQEEPAPPKRPEPAKLGGSGFFAERAQKKLEEEQKKKKEEEDKEARKQEEEKLKEENRKKKEEEKQKKKLEEEEKKRKEQEEKEARKKEEEEAKKRRAEEVKKRKADEEARKKKEAEEEEARKREKQDQIKRARSESSAKKLELEEQKRKEAEEQKKKEAEEEERKKEILRKKREEMKGRAQEEEKKKEEATNKRSSIRVLHRSITETFVAHNKLADVSSSSSTVLSPLSTPRDTPRDIASPRDAATPRDATTPRDASTPRDTVTPRDIASPRDASTPRDTSPREQASTPRDTPASTVHTLLTPRASSPSSLPSSVPPASLTITSSAPSASPSPSHLSASPYSPPLGQLTTAAEKVVKLQGHSKLACPAADVMCTWTSTTDNTIQSHVASCPFFQLRPVLLKLLHDNEELHKKVEQLQSQQHKDHEALALLQHRSS